MRISLIVALATLASLVSAARFRPRPFRLKRTASPSSAADHHASRSTSEGWRED